MQDPEHDHPAENRIIGVSDSVEDKVLAGDKATDIAGKSLRPLRMAGQRQTLPADGFGPLQRLARAVARNQFGGGVDIGLRQMPEDNPKRHTAA